ncbi:MAG: deoxyribose-phosphate aldolase [Clostridia bacterium]|nr:deoxyribose-phosphate aldolase [Clostridia bacterium]
MKQFSRYFDHTLLKPAATREEISRLCSEAVKYDFFSVCVNGCHVRLAKELLAGCAPRVCCVVGFPLGATDMDTKIFETVTACENGADEIDMVINVGALKDKSYEYVEDEISAVVAAADEYNADVKVILETCLLDDEEICRACELAVSAGAEFVKTSTGFGGGGATVHDIELMRKTVGNLARVKASGGIRDLETCLKMIEAGADRIGASASVAIMEEYEKSQQ